MGQQGIRWQGDVGGMGKGGGTLWSARPAWRGLSRQLAMLVIAVAILLIVFDCRVDVRTTS